MAKPRTTQPAASRGRAAKPAAPDKPARGKKSAKDQAAAEAKTLRKRGRQGKLAGVTRDGDIEELNKAVIDAYEKTEAWRNALQPMVLAKAKVQDLLHKYELSVYTADDAEESTATLATAKEKVKLSRKKRAADEGGDGEDDDWGEG